MAEGQSRRDRGKTEPSRYLTNAANTFEADIVCARLAAAGIPAQIQAFTEGGINGGSIYVEEKDLDRARETLKTAESISEEELIKLSEHSTQHARAPKLGVWQRMLMRVGRGKRSPSG